MKIEEVEFKNFCQFASLQQRITPGMTAIIGPNGSGKSNFLGGIRFALTGENPNAGTSDKNIYDVAPTTEPSFVRVVFEHAGVRAEVQRNLRPEQPTASLRILTTGETVTGASKINPRVLSIIGIGREVLNEMVIVGQSDIFGFLAKRPADRANAFQKLFHTEKAALVHKVLGEHIQSLEIPAPAVDIAELDNQIHQLENEVAAAGQLLSGYPSFEEITRQRDTNAGIVRTYEHMLQLQKLQQTCAADREANQKWLVSLQQQREESYTELIQVDQALRDNQQQLENAKDLAIKLTYWQEQHKSRDGLKNRLEHVTRSLEDLLKSTPASVPGCDADLEATLEEIAGLQHERQRLQTLLRSFSDGTAACPTCGTSVTELAHVLESAKSQLPLLDQRYNALTTQVAAVRSYRNALQLHNSNCSQLQASKEMLQQQLAAFSTPETPPADPQMVQAQIDVANQSEAMRKSLDQLVRSRDVDIAHVRGILQQAARQIEEYAQQLAGIPAYNESQYREAGQNVGLWEKSATDRRAVETRLTVAQNSLAACQRQRQEANAALAKAQTLRTWVTQVKAWRDLVHKDAAPKFVAQQNLQRLEASINEILEMFQTNYRVRADEGLSFVAHFNQGSKQAAERLSEGQKVVLALAFRMALNALFTENIGALYLDEPTAYLDDHHIKGFEPVLDRLHGYSTARGLQVLIITHEKSIAPLFDDVIQL